MIETITSFQDLWIDFALMNVFFLLCFFELNVWLSDCDTDSEMPIGAITRKERICYLVSNCYFMYKNMVIQLNVWRQLLILWNLGTITQKNKVLVTSQERDTPYWNIKIWNMGFQLHVLNKIDVFPGMEARHKCCEAIFKAVSSSDRLLGYPGVAGITAKVRKHDYFYPSFYFIYLFRWCFYRLTKHTDVHWLSAAPGSYQERSFPRKKEKRSSAGCHDSREVLM